MMRTSEDADFKDIHPELTGDECPFCNCDPCECEADIPEDEDDAFEPEYD